MRTRFHKLRNSDLMSSDGAIGKVDDLLIQDDQWVIRYFVVKIQNTLPTRHVLISTAAIQEFDVNRRLISTLLTSQQVINSPRLDDDQPISRQYEEALVEHFGWPIYWLGRAVQLSPQTMEELADDDVARLVDEKESANLRSAKEICGYQILANNGQAGFMKDLVIAVNSWTIEFATAEPSNWLPSHGTMFSTKHVDSIDWADRKISVDLRKEVLEPIDESKPVTTGELWSAQPFRPA